MKREDLTNEQIDAALTLLDEAAEHFGENEEAGPNATWHKRYFQLDGTHMILTDEGWEHGSSKAAYEEAAQNAEEQIEGRCKSWGYQAA